MIMLCVVEARYEGVYRRRRKRRPSLMSSSWMPWQTGATTTATRYEPATSPNKAKGQFDRSAFKYIEQDDEYECPAGERLTYRFTRTEANREIRRYCSSACPSCPIKAQCTTGDNRRVSRWVHADVLERAQTRLDSRPDIMRTRRATVEHPFGTLKSWMGSTHFQMKTLPRVSTEMSLHVLSYNMKRAINLLKTEKIVATIRA